MELKIYDKTNTSKKIEGARSIRINRKSKTIYFSKELIIFLKLDQGSKLIFAEGGRAPYSKNKNWYIAKVEDSDEKAFKVYRSTSSLYSQSAGLTRLILKGSKEDSAKFLISKEHEDYNGVKFYQLISL